jgi:predicted AlkP superfamily pyrophosphatase or phosphodiesterase
MMRRVLFGCVLGLFSLGTATPPLAATRPSLVVVIVVDQMRRDYVEDYGSHWTKGLRRLLDEGAWYPNAAYPYLTTLTCAGHATIATGTFPATHGIINNTWWDRETQKNISCSSDATSREVPYGDRQPGGGGGARLLKVPTFADALADSPQHGHIVTLSMKRASAVMLAGQKADAALWLQGTGWSSSTAYAPAPEKSLLRFIQANPVEADFGKSWSRMGKASDYTYDDAGMGEKPPPEWDPIFPHLLQARDGKPTTFFYAAWDESPYSDAYVARMASAAIDGMKLGQGPGTDYLAISFSALDVVGHDFGPRSHEIQDVLMRIDETLGKFLADLDKKVGKDRYVLAFTADHGVAEIPEQAKAEGKDAGRILMNDIMARTDQTMSAKFGAGHWVAVQAYSELYFRAGVFEKLTGDPELLASVIHGIEAVPGVQRVIDSRALEAPPPANEDAATQAARRSYFPGRSGDLLIIPKPNWIFVSDDKTIIPGNATTHGTNNDYDQRVPLILFGGGIAKGRYETAVTPADIAPTLARLCGISLPTATGHPLDEALPRQ